MTAKKDYREMIKHLPVEQRKTIHRYLDEMVHGITSYEDIVSSILETGLSQYDYDEYHVVITEDRGDYKLIWDRQGTQRDIDEFISCGCPTDLWFAPVDEVWDERVETARVIFPDQKRDGDVSVDIDVMEKMDMNNHFESHKYPQLTTDYNEH